MMMTSLRRTKTQQPASFFDDAFMSQGLQPPHDPRPFSERDSVIRTPVGKDFANQPNDVATLGRNLAVLGYVPFDDASVQGAFTPKLEAGVRAVQKKEQKTNNAFKVDGHVSVKTQDVIQKRLRAHAAEKASGVALHPSPTPVASAPVHAVQSAKPSQVSAISAAAEPQRGHMLALVRNAEAAAAKRVVPVTEAETDQPTFADEVDPAQIAARIWAARPEDRAAAEAAAMRHLPRGHEDRRKIRRALDEAAIAAEFDYASHAPTVAAGADAARAAATEIQAQGMAFRDGTGGAFRMGLPESGKTPFYDADGTEAVSLPADEARLVGEYAVKTGNEALSEAAVRPLTALMEGMLEDRAAGRPIDIRDAAPLGRQVANILAEAAPGLGEAMSARDAEIAGALALEAYENDELRDFLIYSVQTGVAAIGAIPLLGTVVRAPKTVIAAAGLILSYGAKNKGAKIAAAAKSGRIPDGVEVSLQRSEDSPLYTFRVVGGDKQKRFEEVANALDAVADDNAYREIGKLVDGAVLDTTKIGGKDKFDKISLDKLGGEAEADRTFEAIAESLQLPVKDLEGGTRLITIPNGGPDGKDLRIVRYHATTKEDPSVTAQIRIMTDGATSKPNNGVFLLKVRFKE
jgi:hypothetical protein